MRTLASRFFATLLIAAGFSPLLHAASYIVPPDADLIREADAIAIVTIQSSHSYFAEDGGIATDYSAVVERTLKGTPRAAGTIVLTQKGGSVGELALSVSGEPQFAAGERALLLMERTGVRRFTTISAELGKFSFVTDTGSRELLLRGASLGEIFGWDLAGNSHVERGRDAATFLRYIERVVAGENAPADYFVEAAAPSPRRIVENGPIPGNDYTSQLTITSTTHGTRAVVCAPLPASCETASASLSMSRVGVQTGVADLTASINNARGAWNNDPSSTINITLSGTGTGTYGNNDGQNLVFFDQPNSGPLAGSTVGQANIWASSRENTNGSDTYFTTVDCDIVVEVGFTGAQFEAILGHEMGHCIGFRHSNQPQAGQTTSSSNALMNSTAPSTATLRAWDQDAASHVYGTGVTTCTPPSITTQPPASKTITSGQPANVTIAAAGTSPLTFQWYIGNRGDTSSPVTGQTSVTLTHAPTATTMYWVRVTGQCAPTADSNNVTVNVNPATCTPPSITNHPQNQTITQGGSTFLTVGVSGTGPFTFQWFIGTPPNTSSPTGTNTNSISVQPNATTSYWVRVIGQCDPAALSNAAQVTVNPSSCPDVVVGAPTATKQSNGSFLLDVTASSGTRPLTYQWFQGTVSGIGTFIGEGKPIVVPAPTAPVSYWARATNDCQKSANSLGVVTIAPCDLPVIGTQPLDQTIASGASATLSVGVTPPTATIHWYRGVAPDKTTEVGTGLSFNTGPLTATTQFWASVGNTCGEIATQTATVTVSGPACDKPAILTLSPAAPKTTKGQTITLVVTASGSETRHYEWYQGASGDTSKKVGTDSNSFISGPLSAPTQFWVKVLNACGDASSSTINVEVTTPKYRSVRH